ncbi:trace amine-associated receptor 7e-like [Oculina patagonica]
MNQSSVIPAKILSIAVNGTELTSKVYVYLPLQSSTRLALFSLLASVGIVGFVGNIFVLYFLKSEKRKTNHLLNTTAFQKNFYVYIKSLAVSDVLSDVVSLPPLCCQMYFDIFNTGWGCKIVRYLNIVFPSVTLNNLLFISIERYLSTRDVPRTFRHSTVKKIVIFAWLAGFFVVLFPAATFKGIRYDLNDTHYTVHCKYDNQYLPFRIIFLSYTIIHYIIPCCIIIKVNISLIITLWTRLRSRAVDVQRDNAIKMMRRAAAIRSTYIAVSLTFAFILPYIFYFAQLIYNMVTQITLDFETDYVIRCASAIIAYSNSVVNVMIYLVQMKDFRAFVKKTITPRFLAQNGVSNAETRM